MAKAKKAVANAPKSGGTDKFGFLAPAAKAGGFNSCSANTAGKKK